MRTTRVCHGHLQHCVLHRPPWAPELSVLLYCLFRTSKSRKGGGWTDIVMFTEDPKAQKGEGCDHPKCQ